MSIDRLDGGVVGDGDVVRGDTDELAMLFVGGMDRQKALSLPSLKEQPGIGEACKTRGWNIAQVSVGGEVWNQEIESEKSDWCPRSDEKIQNGF